jgi:hypothetical protein
MDDMTDLRQAALRRLAMGEDDVEAAYTINTSSRLIRSLCESHERLRVELQGAETIIDDMRREIASVVMIMNELSATWGDEGVFRRCRDRLAYFVSDNTKGL